MASSVWQQREKEITLILPDTGCALQLVLVLLSSEVGLGHRKHTSDQQSTTITCASIMLPAVVVPFILAYNDSSGSMIHVHVTVVLQIGATSCSCLLP